MVVLDSQHQPLNVLNEADFVARIMGSTVVRVAGIAKGTLPD